MVKYLVVFLMVMLAIANGYGGSKEADNARARLFASNSQLGKPNFFFNPMRCPHANNVIQHIFQELFHWGILHPAETQERLMTVMWSKPIFQESSHWDILPLAQTRGPLMLVVWLKPIFLIFDLWGILLLDQIQGHLIWQYGWSPFS